MAFNNEGVGAIKARRAIHELTGFGIDTPAPVQDRLDRLDALAAAAPKHPGDQKLIDATLDGDPDRITAAATELATHEHRQRAHAAAMHRAGMAVTEALRAHRKPIITKLTEQAKQAADRITAARQLNSTVEALVIAGRHDDASLLAALPANRQVLHRLTEWADKNLGEFLDVADPEAAPAA